MMETFPNIVNHIKTESPAYTMVDVKFEAGGGSQELISQFVKSEEEFDNPNKRKRSVPKKLSVEDEEGEYWEKEEVKEEEEEEEEEVEVDMSEVVKVEYGDVGEDDGESEERLLMTRANNQRVNCKQREDCPVCGDKANGKQSGVSV